MRFSHMVKVYYAKASHIEGYFVDQLEALLFMMAAHFPGAFEWELLPSDQPVKENVQNYRAPEKWWRA